LSFLLGRKKIPQVFAKMNIVQEKASANDDDDDVQSFLFAMTPTRESTLGSIASDLYSDDDDELDKEEEEQNFHDDAEESSDDDDDDEEKSQVDNDDAKPAKKEHRKLRRKKKHHLRHRRSKSKSKSNNDVEEEERQVQVNEAGQEGKACCSSELSSLIRQVYELMKTEKQSKVLLRFDSETICVQREETGFRDLSEYSVDAVVYLQARIRKFLIRRRFEAILRDYRKSKSAAQLQRRWNVLNEIVSSERSYVEALDNCLEWFARPLRDVIARDDWAALFLNLESICGAARRFLAALEARMSQYPTVTLFGDIFTHHLSQFVSEYATYMMGYDASYERYQRLMAESAEFAEFVNGALKQHNVVVLGSLLITPVQRLPRYQMLCKELLKSTPETHVDYAHIETALAAVTSSVRSIDWHKEQLAHAAAACATIVDWRQLSPEPLVTPSRRLLCQGKLRSLDPETYASLGSFYVMLFSDMLLLTKATSAKRRRAVAFYTWSQLGADDIVQFDRRPAADERRALASSLEAPPPSPRTAAMLSADLASGISSALSGSASGGGSGDRARGFRLILTATNRQPTQIVLAIKPSSSSSSGSRIGGSGGNSADQAFAVWERAFAHLLERNIYMGSDEPLSLRHVDSVPKRRGTIVLHVGAARGIVLPTPFSEVTRAGGDDSGSKLAAPQPGDGGGKKHKRSRSIGASLPRGGIYCVCNFNDSVRKTTQPVEPSSKPRFDAHYEFHVGHSLPSSASLTIELHYDSPFGEHYTLGAASFPLFFIQKNSDSSEHADPDWFPLLTDATKALSGVLSVKLGWRPVDGDGDDDIGAADVGASSSSSSSSAAGTALRSFKGKGPARSVRNMLKKATASSSSAAATGSAASLLAESLDTTLLLSSSSRRSHSKSRERVKSKK
jgi:RhoGEF domain